MTVTPPPPPAPPSPTPPVPPAGPPAHRGGSAKWFVLGGAGCLLMLFGLCVIAGVVLFFLHSTTLPNEYHNDKSKLAASLQGEFVPFSFRYPGDWKLTEDGSKVGDENFVKVEKSVREGEDDITLENFTVSGGKSNGSVDEDIAQFTLAGQSLAASFASQLQEYSKTADGETTINGYKAYHIAFMGKLKANGKSGTLYARFIMIPGGNVGEKNDVLISMFASDRQSAIRKPEDLGVKGDTGKILPTFKLGK